MREVYLDHHSATRPLPHVVEAMLPFWGRYWGSTTSLHQKGQELFAPIQESSERLLTALGASPRDRVYFFSSYTEAMSHLFLSYYIDNMRSSGKNHVVTTSNEDAVILMSIKRLEEIGGVGKILPVNRAGLLTAESLREQLVPRSSLLSLSWANGLTGVIQPVEALATLCKQEGMHVHVDASYAIGKVPLCLKDLPIDFLTFDGSVLHAPKGTAALIVKADVDLSPPLSAMTGVCVEGLVALSTAVYESIQRIDVVGLETARLRDRFEKEIQKECPGVLSVFRDSPRLPNCTTLVFPRIASDALLYLLHRNQVYASLGGGQSQRLSHLIVASGIDPFLSQCALSFALSFETTQEEIERAISVVVRCVKQQSRLTEGL